MNHERPLPPSTLEPEPDPPQPRRNHRGWRIFALSLLGFVCFLIAAALILGALINSDGEHRALIRFAQKQASNALGVRVRIQNIAIHLATLSVDVYGVAVDGAGPHPAPPLLTVNHAQLGVRIVSLFADKWYLSSLRIDRPVVWIYVDKNGVSNLPVFKSSGSSGNNNEIFNLGIRHAVLDDGEAYYNNRPQAFAASLRNLELRAAYNPAHKTYAGRLAYADGVLKYGPYQPLQHNLDVSFALTPTNLQINKATLSSGDSQALLTAAIDRYDTHPALQAEYSITVDGAQFRRLLHDPSIPTGFLHTKGSLRFQEQANRPPLQSLVLEGDLASSRLELTAAGAHAEITSLAAHYSLDHGNATLRSVRAGVLGGELTAQGTMTGLGGFSHSSVSAALHNISLAQLKRLAGHSAPMRGIALAGVLNAKASAAWGRTLADLTARADASIRGQIASAAANPRQNSLNASSAPPPAATPVDGEMHAAYARSNGSLTLTSGYLHAAQTQLAFNGTIGKSSSLAFKLQAGDLRELSAVINAFRPPASGQTPLQLSGTASFNGGVQGSIASPRLSGLLTAQGLHVNGSSWKLVRANILASPDHAALQDAQLEPEPAGNIALTASAGLRQWRFTSQSPIQVDVHASRVAIADLIALTGTPLPVTGSLSTNVSVRGNLMNPEGTGNINLTAVTAYGQPVKAIHVSFSGNENEARANLAVDLPAGGVQAKVTVQPRQRTYSAQLTSPGIHLDRLAALQARHIQASGVLTLNASGQGSFDNPELAATLQSPSLTVAGQTISALKLQLNAANHVANLALSSTAQNAPIDAQAAIRLTGDYLADATLNTPVFSLQPILALYAPDEAGDISGQTQIHALLHGPLKDMKQLEAQVTIPVLKVAYQNTVQLAEAAPLQINYRDGVIDVPPGAIRGTDTDLAFQGRIPMAGGQPMSIQLHGAVNLQIAQLLSPGIRSSGQLKLDIESRGALAEGANLGEIDIVNASFSDPSAPIGIENGNGVLQMTTDHINVRNFEATVGGGEVRLIGGVQYRPHLQIALAAAAQGVRMLYPQGVRENIDANIHLDGSPHRSLLSGRVDLADVSFTPAFDLSDVAGQLSGGIEGPPPQGFAQNLALNLAVHSGNTLNLTSRELSIDGAANLQVRGTAAQPVILGRINLTGGDMIFNGNRFVLTGGTIQFINPSQTEPVLNLSISTNVQQYQIDMRLQGPASQMRTEYSSNPSLPQADIIHLLAFGSTTEAAASNPTPANQAAESLIASQMSSQLTSRISKVAGISQLSISPVLQGGGAQGPAGAVITIRQRVSGNLFITFSTNAATTQNQVIQGQYQVSPHFAISATRNENGGFGVDALIKRSW
ncbi:MAG TPA: translocation/assembly module TamB domain-containing protein [Terracidiphilus sp.]|nr:translocation/assembly module TamB domain-containing protein [Terracidiphilus sp.]